MAGGIFMDRNKNEGGRDLRFLLRAAVGWFGAAMLLLPLCAAIVTLADLKASSFPIFGAVISFLAAAAAGYAARGKSVMPSWKIAGACAMTLTIVLLTIGFLISAEDLSAESILLSVLPTWLGCFLGIFLASRGKKLQKRRNLFKTRKQVKFT